ncbi:hypothetical protein SAMN05216201_109104 [Pseudomonas linyingensis]|uniref:Uncharacterized protein n=1 Tax=Pseudomonas linyingensis TaxID=915471 RepID=A0A1H6Z0V3_9PSED|nr:hypothetical protein [Pseudomonas linyingensis]SEJ47058.1 hypothetical protein SAMN05216201_109104 [Pseudomonas linyingensis]
MAGLDTRGVMDGFAQGFGLVDGYLNRQAAQQRSDQQMAMQERGLQMREQEFSAQQEQHQQQRDQQMIGQFYTGWASGIEAPISEELAGAFERNKMADPRHLFNPRTEQAVEYANKLSSGEGSLFSPETVERMNDFYAPRVSRGQGGKKRLAGMYPGQREGTLVFELEVEDEQGGKRLVPMTKNRGIAGEDDEVAQYDIEQAIGPVMGAKSLYQALGQSREKMLGYLRASGYLAKDAEKWEQVDGPDGSILQRNTATGEMKSVIGRPRVAGNGGAGGGLTSQQKNYHFLRDEMDYPEDKAFQASFGGTGAVNGRVSDGAKMGLQLLNAQIKEVDARLNGKGALAMEEDELAALRQERADLTAQRSSLAESLGLAGVPQKKAGSEPAPQPQQPTAQQSQRDAPTDPRRQAADDILASVLGGGAAPSPAEARQDQQPRQAVPDPASGLLSWEQQMQAAMQEQQRRQLAYEEARRYQPVTRTGLQLPAQMQGPQPWQGVGLDPNLVPR